MAEKDKASRAALVISVGAAITSALALLQKRAQAAPPEGVVQLPEELWNLIIAIAASINSVDTDLDEVITAIKSLVLEGGMGWPPNANSGTSLRVAIAVTGTRLPYIAVPSGMSLVIMGWPLNPGWLQVGFSMAECVNVNQSFPLVPGQVAGYQIENADKVYIAATVPGCFACLTVEQRKGGAG